MSIRDAWTCGLTLLAATMMASPQATAQQQQRPNIVFIMGDDVGWFNIGAYHRGMMAGRTPNLDQLASEGMMFTDFSVRREARRSSTRTGLTVKLPTDLDGGGVDPRFTTYAVELQTKVLSRDSRRYTYFDYARAIRE